MTQTKGHCKHGEFDLETGCPACIEDRGEKKMSEMHSISDISGFRHMKCVPPVTDWMENSDIFISVLY